MLAKKMLPREDKLEDIDIVKVRLVKEGSCPYGEVHIRKSEDAAYIVREFLANEDREKFITLNLDNEKKINSIHVVSVGSPSAAIACQREIFKTAILSNASAIILAHNHPSGDPEPSPEDKKLTCTLFECGDLLGIEILDHIVIGDNQYVHFMKVDKGLCWETKTFQDHQKVS
jgi:DNA repair protein RadC